MSTLKELEDRIAAVEEWQEEFERGAAQAEEEMQALFEGDTVIEFIPDPTLLYELRDKKKDN